MDVTCKYCNTVLEVTDENLFGEDAICPNCNKTIYVPLPESTEESLPTPSLAKKLPHPLPMVGNLPQPLPPITTQSKINDKEFKKQLLFIKKKWDKMDRMLQKLRDKAKVYGRISATKKADMIVFLDKDKRHGSNDVFEFIQRNFPEHLNPVCNTIETETSNNNGCGCLVLIIALPIAVFLYLLF